MKPQYIVIVIGVPILCETYLDQRFRPSTLIAKIPDAIITTKDSSLALLRCIEWKQVANVSLKIIKYISPLIPVIMTLYGQSKSGNSFNCNRVICSVRFFSREFVDITVQRF